jgi:effector-binding domain-containing protein
MAISAVEIAAESTTGQPVFTIRKVEKQVVLYTIHRGSYDKVGMAIGKLFALAGQKGITPRGQVSYVYLNNPQYVSSEHWLTEIQIPVGEDALKFAGTLGEIIDVKTLPAMEMAVAVKPEGQADPGPIYDGLYAWIARQGYRAVDNACEKFLTNAIGGNYSQMKSEIMVPIKKLSQNND